MAGGQRGVIRKSRAWMQVQIQNSVIPILIRIQGNDGADSNYGFNPLIDPNPLCLVSESTQCCDKPAPK